MEVVTGAVEINSDGFKVEAGEEESGRRRLGGRNNADGAVLHFPLPPSARGRMAVAHVAVHRELKLDVSQ
jgi:hypothetical protein